MSQTLHDLPEESGIQFELFFEPVGEKKMWKLTQLSQMLAAQRKPSELVIHIQLP